MTAAGEGAGRSLDPSVVLARIEEFLRREQAAAQRDHLATLSRPPVERVARGRAIGPIRYVGEQAGDWAFALSADDSRFREGEMPADMPEVTVQGGKDGILIAQMLKQASLTPSTTEAQRMIEQGGVKLDGERVSDKGLRIPAGRTVVAQVGKRKWAKISVK